MIARNSYITQWEYFGSFIPNIRGVDETKNGDPVCISEHLVLKILEEHKAVILQKYARAWLARRRFQSIRRFVLNIQLTYRVQRLQKKLEDQVSVGNASFMLTFSNRFILFWASSLAMQLRFIVPMSGGSNSLHRPPELDNRSTL